MAPHSVYCGNPPHFDRGNSQKHGSFIDNNLLKCRSKTRISDLGKSVSPKESFMVFHSGFGFLMPLVVFEMPLLLVRRREATERILKTLDLLRSAITKHFPVSFIVATPWHPLPTTCAFLWAYKNCLVPLLNMESRCYNPTNSDWAEDDALGTKKDFLQAMWVVAVLDLIAMIAIIQIPHSRVSEKKKLTITKIKIIINTI